MDTIEEPEPSPGSSGIEDRPIVAGRPAIATLSTIAGGTAGLGLAALSPELSIALICATGVVIVVVVVLLAAIIFGRSEMPLARVERLLTLWHGAGPPAEPWG